MSNFGFKDYRQPSTDFMLSLRFADGCAVSFEWLRYRFAEDHKTTSSCRMTIVCCLAKRILISEIPA